MKKATVLVIGFVGLFMIGCFSSYDYGAGNWDYPRIAISDAFTFENKENYQVGDTIF